jgi:hypothetical protein
VFDAVLTDTIKAFLYAECLVTKSTVIIPLKTKGSGLDCTENLISRHLTNRQKGVYYMSVKIFNSLIPKFLADVLENETLFIGKLKEILIHNVFYLVDEFLNYFQDS